jgi:hypothetical protein
MVRFTDEQLTEIYDKTGGYCRYCEKKLAFTNYGKAGRKGAWEVDHANPVSRGGTDYYRNLSPACIECNRDKSDRTAQSYQRSVDQSSTSSGNGCFVATAAYGSSLAPEVDRFRVFRDAVLLRRRLGRLFVRAYYALSPPAAAVVRRSAYFRRTARIFLSVIARRLRVSRASLQALREETP